MEPTTESTHQEAPAATDAAATESTEGAAPKIKAMRRQPCPCGSGKKFKNCHEGDPGYEVATEQPVGQAPVTPTAGLGTKGPASGNQHFPPQQQKNIPSQRNSAPLHRRKV
jgi:hypothetical protein